MTLPVFFAHDVTPPAAGLTVGDHAHMGGAEGKHAATVKRISPGESLDIVDGSGLRLTCEVVGASGGGLEVIVRERIVEAAPKPRLTLVQALAKGGRDEAAVETATEIGIDQVIPWQADRSIVRWAGPKATRGHAKWDSVARAAAKQSRRAFVPTVGQVLGTRELGAWVRTVIDEGGAVVICHEDAAHTLAHLLAQGGLEAATHIAIVVGPEGGISPDELTELRHAGALAVLLGPHVLRSSSAGPAAATLISAGVSRW